MNTQVAYLRNKYWFEKLVRNPWFWASFISISFALPLVRTFMREMPKDPPVFFPAPQFNLIDENGAAYGPEQLKGKLYVASFFFTSCQSVCPRINQKLKVVQKRLRGLGTHVQILSFSVDPETDTPPVLFAKARELEANPYVWKFLTGPTEEMKKTVVDGFKVVMGKKEGEGSLIDVAHSEKLVLVDLQGQIRGYYSIDDKSLNQLVVDTGILANKI